MIMILVKQICISKLSAQKLKKLAPCIANCVALCQLQSMHGEGVEFLMKSRLHVLVLLSVAS